MATNDVEIVNNALLLLGDKTITALADATDSARVANGIYATTRDAVLRVHPWNFARARAALVITTAPPFGFTNAFTLPTDFIRAIAINDMQVWGEGGSFFAIEGGKLLTNCATANLRYIKQVTDTTLFDSLFNEAFIFRLASAMAYPITGSMAVAQQMWTLYEAKLKQANIAGGGEGTSPNIYIHDLIAVR